MALVIVKERIGRLRETGFFSIMVAGVLNKAISTVLSVVLVRIVPKEAYGVYSYAYSIISLFMLFNGVGMGSATLQVCSELSRRPRKMWSLLRFGTRVGSLFDSMLGTVILLVALLVPFKMEGASRILALCVLLPLLTFLCEMKQIQLRMLLMNREYALVTNIQTAVNAACSCAGAFVASAEGMVVGQTFGLAVCYLLTSRMYPVPFERNRSGVTDIEGRDLLGIGAISCFNNGIAQALTLVGSLLIGTLMASEAMAASYSVATKIPFALLFIPSMVVIYITPYFVRHKDEYAWTIRNYIRVVAGIGIVMGFVSLGVISLADPIVRALFGVEYLDCVPALRVLMLGMLVSATLRVPTGNLLVTQRKLKANIYVGIANIIIDVIASYLLIPTFGAVGAAISYFATMSFGAIANVIIYLHTVRGLKGVTRA